MEVVADPTYCFLARVRERECCSERCVPHSFWSRGSRKVDGKWQLASLFLPAMLNSFVNSEVKEVNGQYIEGMCQW